MVTVSIDGDDVVIETQADVLYIERAEIPLLIQQLQEFVPRLPYSPMFEEDYADEY